MGLVLLMDVGRPMAVSPAVRPQCRCRLSRTQMAPKTLTFSPLRPSLPGLPLVPGSPLRPYRDGCVVVATWTLPSLWP